MPPPPQQSSLDLATRLGVLARSCAVVATTRLSPSLVEVVLSGEASLLAGVPGNDVMVLVDEVGSTPTRRRFSVRALDSGADTFSLWISTTHDGPAVRWVGEARAGDTIDVIGPRGKIPLDPSADWHLFLGDVSALGTFYRVAESIAAPGRAMFVVEVDSPDDALTTHFDEGLEVTAVFVARDGRGHDDPRGLLNALATQGLPPGAGHAYLFGEFHAMRAARSALVDRGVPSDRISLKAYYRVGQANGANGEPAKDL